MIWRHGTYSLWRSFYSWAHTLSPAFSLAHKLTEQTQYFKATETTGLLRWCLLRCHLPMQETQKTWLRSLGQKDPLEEGMATHSSILAWRIPWTEESSRLQSRGLQRIGHDWSNLAHTHAQSAWRESNWSWEPQDSQAGGESRSHGDPLCHWRWSQRRRWPWRRRWPRRRGVRPPNLQLAGCRMSTHTWEQDTSMGPNTDLLWEFKWLFTLLPHGIKCRQLKPVGWGQALEIR